MNNMRGQKTVSIIVIAAAIFSIIQLTGVQPSEAEDRFGITTSGNLIPETEMDATEGRFSTSQFDIELSVPVLEIGYSLTSFVDILGSSAEFGYTFFPSFEVELSYDSEDSLHRLSDDSPVELVTTKTYLNTDADVVSL